ncbi:MAG: alpha/beta fold hydrolase [Neisseriaceae bacterium]|nr:alpha/beta fold hydrolase [Neisseriaceae bacterium]
MQKIKLQLKILLSVIFIVFSLTGCLYIFQEKFIFAPTTLPKNYVFQFNTPFEELNIVNTQNITLNGLHFYAQNTPKAKEAILFLHGNADNIEKWGKLSWFYTQQGYDFFVFDYQGYGKSGGKIKNEQQLYNDIHLMFNKVLNYFEKDKITIIGYSIGTGLAAETAQHFGISKLVLIAPYFNFKQLAQQKMPYAPISLLRYQIPSNQFIHNLIQQKPNIKILIIHGEHDKVIPITHSQQLFATFPQNIQFKSLNCCGHNDLIMHEDFYRIMTEYFRQPESF